jgi:hypothetical protein
MNQEKDVISFVERSIIINFLYEKLHCDDIMQKLTGSDLFQKYMLQAFYVLYFMIIGSVIFLLNSFWYQCMFAFLAIKSYMWFYINHVLQLSDPYPRSNESKSESESESSKSIELMGYFSSFFVLMAFRSIYCVPVHYLQISVGYCTVLFTIKLISDPTSRKMLLMFLVDKLTKPLNELYNVFHLICFLFQCAVNCISNGPMILPVTKITNISDFTNVFKSLSMIADQNDSDNNDSNQNESNQNESNQNESNQNESNQNESNQLDDECDLDESL